MWQLQQELSSPTNKAIESRKRPASTGLKDSRLLPRAPSTSAKDESLRRQCRSSSSWQVLCMPMRPLPTNRPTLHRPWCRYVGSALLVDQWHQQILGMRSGRFYLSWRDSRQSRHIVSIKTSSSKTPRRRCPWQAVGFFGLPNLAQTFLLLLITK